MVDTTGGHLERPSPSGSAASAAEAPPDQADQGPDLLDPQPAGEQHEQRPAEGEDYAQQIAFEVAKDANKIEIRKAVQTLFKVSVTAVRTQVVRGKKKRIGRFMGQRPAWKKAIVTLKPGDSISFFEGV